MLARWSAEKISSRQEATLKTCAPCLVLILLAGWLLAGKACAEPPVLTPGTSFAIQFPEMPPTFYALAQNVVWRPR